MIWQRRKPQLWPQDEGNKFGNTKIEVDGHSFHSRLEAAVYGILKLREKAGEIELLQCQDHLYLSAARIGYIPDFKCKDLKTGNPFWAEAKGFADSRWPTVKKLYKFYGPGPLQIYTGTWRNPVLSEVIVPKGIENDEPSSA
jgi:hypothetical protein